MNEKHGWYLYDGTRIAGPLSIEALQQAQHKCKTPNRLLITRKGYDQWFPINHLDKWCDQFYTDELKREITAFQKEVDQSAALLERLQPQQPVIAKVKPQVIQNRKKKQERTRQSKRKRNKAAANQARANLAEANAAENNHIGPGASKDLYFDPTLPMTHNYMLLRGRLRLGNLRSPELTAVLCSLCSAGLYNPFWFRSVYQDVKWHVANEIKVPSLLLSLLFMVPVLACLPSLWLGREIARMEVQNRYRAISPWLAGILGVFPPFAVYYLQCAVNDHWLLHVKNCQ